MSKPRSAPPCAPSSPRPHATPNSSDSAADRPDSDARSLVNLAIALVDSGLDVLHDPLTADEQLQHQSAFIPGGTLGKHFRHVAETYDAFLSALKADPYDSPPQIDYNARRLPSSRKTVARSLDECREALFKVRGGLVALGDAKDLDAVFQQPVEVIAITPTRQEMNSTLGRELWFCSLHAIHHFTMVRVIACNELGLHLPIEFGTAPATIHYRGKGWKAPPVSSPSIKSKL